MRLKRREATRRNHVTATIRPKRNNKHIVLKGSGVLACSGPLNPKTQNKGLATPTKKTKEPWNSKPPVPTPLPGQVQKTKRMEKRLSFPIGFDSNTPSHQIKRQTAQASKSHQAAQTIDTARSSAQSTGQTKLSTREAPYGLHHPSDKELASRPDNRLCVHCNGYVHKDRLSDHFKKKHGLPMQDAVLAVAAATPKPTAHTGIKWRISSPVGISEKTEPKRKVETTYAQKRREMKETFREIDRLNFPPGARLTSNSSGSLPRGGGFMSKKTK